MSEQKISILLLEQDEAEAARLEALLMESEGENYLIDVHWVQSLPESLLLIRHQNFQVIMLGLPLLERIGEGLSVLRLIRQLRPATPIIALVAQEIMGLGLQALELGAYAYFPRHQLNSEMVRRLVARAAAQQSILQDAQDIDSLSEVAIESLPVQVAVLDAGGVITAVNQEWEKQAQVVTDPLIAQTAPGLDYLAHMRQREAAAVVNGLQAILSGQQTRFHLEYSQIQGSDVCWYMFCITPMRWPVGGAIISRFDVSSVVAHEIRTNAQQEELANLRNQVASLTHELRSPLTAMRLYVDLATQGKPEKQAQYLGVLSQQVLYMEQLVNDLLVLSKLQQDDVPRHFVSINLNDLVQHVMLLQQPMAAEKGLDVVFVDADLPPILGDTRLLTRVVTNLLANAIRYTRNGRITLATTFDASTNRVNLSVMDTGIGITPEMLPHIFEPFFRTPRAKQTAETGTGLGLNIVREIVQQHNGGVGVTSEVGRGSTFLVWFPAHPPLFGA